MARSSMAVALLFAATSTYGLLHPTGGVALRAAASHTRSLPQLAHNVPSKSVRAAVHMMAEAVPPMEITPSEPVAEESTAMKAFQSFSNGFSTLFPLWTLMVALGGLFRPGIFTGISTSYFTGLLGLLMLSMGITLTVDDFKRVLQRPGVMVFGFLGCYGMMPALALGLSKVFGLPASMTAGMILVGSINGGQASNLCTYIARGDVALSVLMTTVTTIGAIFMTPLICKLLLGTIVPVDAVGVAISTIQVVLVPIILGMLTNFKFPKVRGQPARPHVPTACALPAYVQPTRPRAACPAHAHASRHPAPRRLSRRSSRSRRLSACCARACSSVARSPSAPRRSARQAWRCRRRQRRCTSSAASPPTLAPRPSIRRPPAAPSPSRRR